MKTPSISPSLVFVFLFIILSCFRPSHSQGQLGFLQCLDIMKISHIVYTPKHPSYTTILKELIDNRRFTSTTTPKPATIVTPEQESHITLTVRCAKKHGIQIRIRGGGHDFEGISSRSLNVDPFVLIDLFKLNKITFDADQQAAWVEAGATLGKLYYEISKVSQTLAFSGGFCPTVGISGHLSGGGFGKLFRKYGLAADNVIDARLIDVNGSVLNRDSMGEDLFWAIRGGGGGSFGVVSAWKVRLVPVPEVMTVLIADRTLDQDATNLVQKWQTIAPELPSEVYAAVQMKTDISNIPERHILKAQFVFVFGGQANELLQLLAQRFPELVAREDECEEASWIQSLLLFNGYPADEPPEVLATRDLRVQRFAYKRKADYVFDPISVSGLEGIWELLKEAETADVLFIANGGIMNNISASALPYPHRAGHLSEVLYTVNWNEDDTETISERYIRWIRDLYDYMTPYVSTSPRAAYVNYRDLDLGVNDGSESVDAQAPAWGIQYFKGNFDRLRSVKTRVDPDNFFRHEQSIPTYPRSEGRMRGNPNMLKATS